MNFSDVLIDIKKLVGLELQSVRPGASITILEVDENKGCLILKTSRGQTRSRPLSELLVIWDELNRVPAVHVEGVLHGSGTSRNQPETILANLPYIEWLKINNKKHIAFVGKNSHAYGTLRQMDPIAAAEIVKTTKDHSTGGVTQVLVVSSDVSETVNKLSSVLQGIVSTVESGVYLFDSPSLRIIVVVDTHISLSPGSYLVIPKIQTNATKTVVICGEKYLVISEASDIKLLMRK